MKNIQSRNKVFQFKKLELFLQILQAEFYELFVRYCNNLSRTNEKSVVIGDTSIVSVHWFDQRRSIAHEWAEILKIRVGEKRSEQTAYNRTEFTLDRLFSLPWKRKGKVRVVSEQETVGTYFTKRKKRISSYDISAEI